MWQWIRDNYGWQAKKADLRVAGLVLLALLAVAFVLFLYVNFFR